MDNYEKIKNLEERIKRLEDIINKITFNEAKEIVFTSCSIGEIMLGNDCKLNFQHCPVGSVIDTDIDDAESHIDDLESRLIDINNEISDIESRIEAVDDHIED